MSAKKRTGTAREEPGVNAGVKPASRLTASSPTPAREGEIRAATEARVEHIAGLMRRLEFRTGETIKGLALEWGLSEQRMRELSAIASKRVRAELTDPDRVTVKVSTVLERVIDEAMAETRDPALIIPGEDGEERRAHKESPNIARRVVVEAARTLAVLTGANAPAKVQITTQSREEWDRLPLAERRLRIAEARRRLDEAEAQLMAEERGLTG